MYVARGRDHGQVRPPVGWGRVGWARASMGNGEHSTWVARVGRGRGRPGEEDRIEKNEPFFV